MARRGYDIAVKCTHDGCTERDRYHFDTRDDMARHFKREPESYHKCVRHRRPDDVLSVSNSTRVDVVTVFETEHGKFWGKEKAFSGFTSGPGFKAFASDFPAGTKIKVTAELILPDETTEQ